MYVMHAYCIVNTWNNIFSFIHNLKTNLLNVIKVIKEQSNHLQLVLQLAINKRDFIVINFKNRNKSQYC